MPKVLRISECLTGADFENTILNILVNLGFDAHLTGKEDRGIDIIASKTVDEKAYKFYIQCKFWNTTVGQHEALKIYKKVVLKNIDYG